MSVIFTGNHDAVDHCLSGVVWVQSGVRYYRGYSFHYGLRKDAESTFGPCRNGFSKGAYEARASMLGEIESWIFLAIIAQFIVSDVARVQRVVGGTNFGSGLDVF